MPLPWRCAVGVSWPVLLVLLAPSARGDATAQQKEQLKEAARLFGQANQLYGQSKYAEAIPLAERVREIRQNVLGKQHPEYANTLTFLAELYRVTGDYARAEPLFHEAAAGFKQARWEDRSEYAVCLNGLAELNRSLGDPAQSEQLFRQVLAIFQNAVGKEHPICATPLQNLAALQESMGDFVKAEARYRQALAIYRQAGWQKHPHYAQCLSNLAYLYQSMGDYAQAEPLYRQALEIRKKELGEKHAEYAQSLNNLASLFATNRDYALAEPLLRQALEIRKQTLGEKHPLYANSLNNLAALYQWQGDYTKAEQIFGQVLEIRKQALGEKHPEYAVSLTNLGKVHQLLADYKRAELLHRQALEITRQALGDKHTNNARILQNLALCYLAANDAAAGEPLAFEGVAIVRQHLGRTAAGQTQRQQLASVLQSFSHLDALLSASADAKTPAEKVYDEILLWKGAVTGGQGAISRFRARLKQAGNSELLGTYYRLLAATRQLDNWLGRSLDSRRLLDQVLLVEQLEKKLANGSAEFRRQLEQRRRTSSDLAHALPANAALIDLLEYNRFLPPVKRKDQKQEWERRLVAFIVRPKQPVTRVELGPAEEIAKAVDKWRHMFGSEETGTAMRRLVWEPLAKHLAGATAVLVSPDGALTRFPFAALPGQMPGRYLIEDIAVAIVPVPQQLPELLAPAGKVAEPSLLVVGAVNYGGGTSHDAWTELPATGPEAQAVRNQFQHLYPRAATSELTGDAATEETVRRLAPQRSYLHFATHGFYDPPGRRSMLAAASQGPMSGPSSAIAGWYPGLLSGLVLAGVNRPPQMDRDNGILTALEWEPFDLTGAELAVLSACQTARGESVVGGEGLLGLQRAFQTAGAKSVVASLWKVDDTATRRLMTCFYYNLWQKKMGRLEALRQAQLGILYDGPGAASGLRAAMEPVAERPVDHATARADPRLWAAWVLSGVPGDLAGSAPVVKWVSAYPPDLSANVEPKAASRWWLMPVLVGAAFCAAYLALLVRKARRLRLLPVGPSPVLTKSDQRDAGPTDPP